MWIFKVLAWLWPFIKEMVLGDKTFKEALDDNKKKVLLIILIFVSLGLNLFLVPRVVVISSNFLALEKENEKNKKLVVSLTTDNQLLRQQNQLLIKEPKERDVVSDDNSTTITSIINKPVPKRVVKNVNSKPDKAIGVLPNARYSKMKDDFDKIKQLEDKEIKE